MLYKFINEKYIQRFHGWWRVDDTIVTNSKAEEYALASSEWKPLVVDDEPEYDSETQYLSYHYEQEEDAIRKVWKVINIPIDDIILDEYNDALQMIADYEFQNN